MILGEENRTGVGINNRVDDPIHSLGASVTNRLLRQAHEHRASMVREGTTLTNLGMSATWLPNIAG